MCGDGIAISIMGIWGNYLWQMVTTFDLINDDALQNRAENFQWRNSRRRNANIKRLLCRISKPYAIENATLYSGTMLKKEASVIALERIPEYSSRVDRS